VAEPWEAFARQPGRPPGTIAPEKTTGRVRTKKTGAQRWWVGGRPTDLYVAVGANLRGARISQASPPATLKASQGSSCHSNQRDAGKRRYCPGSPGTNGLVADSSLPQAAAGAENGQDVGGRSGKTSRKVGIPGTCRQRIDVETNSGAGPSLDKSWWQRPESFGGSRALVAPPSGKNGQVPRPAFRVT